MDKRFFFYEEKKKNIKGNRCDIFVDIELYYVIVFFIFIN